MSQLPDKIWLHKDTKYSTADTVCGYQYKFLAENEGIENFVEYTRTDALIEKAREYLQEHLIDYWPQGVTDESKFVNEFIEYIKGE